VTRGWSGPELQRLGEIEQQRVPFLCWLDAEGEQQFVLLTGSHGLTVGRRSSNDVVLPGDAEVSRVHARLELVDQDWTIVDDGLSRNGTFVNGSRVVGRRRLQDGDWLRFGTSTIQFRAPAESTTAVTLGRPSLPDPAHLTPIQRSILTALCRDYSEGAEFPRPCTNAQIAKEVFLSVDAVKTHLRALFMRFGIPDLPQNQKRATLAEMAIRAGVAHAHSPSRS